MWGKFILKWVPNSKIIAFFELLICSFLLITSIVLLNIAAIPYPISTILFIINSIAIIFVILFLLANILRFDKIIIILFLISVCISMIYIQKTPYDLRSHDAPTHIEYIEFVVKNNRLPRPDAGWEFSQPPLYYLTATQIYKASTYFNLDPIKNLQYFSLFLYEVFLIFGILIFKYVFLNSNQKRKEPEKNSSKLKFYLATALLLFWPSGFIHSARVTNEIMFYMFYAAGFYFALKWYTNNHSRDFYWAAIFTGLGILTKTTALSLMGIMGTIFLIKIFKEKNISKYLKTAVFFLVISAIAIGLNLGRNYKYSDHGRKDWISYGATLLPQELRVENSFSNYIYFDLPTFIKRPFTSAWIDAGGRQYFWNYLFKTSLFGEFDFPVAMRETTLIKWLALSMSIEFLFLLIFSIIGFVNFIRKRTSLSLIIILNSIILLAALLFYKISRPFSCNGDFRFIYPAIISFCIFIPSGVDLNFLPKRNIWNLLILITSIVFIISSCLFIIAL